MDPLDGVTVFVTVAECGSFSAAAEKLGCSKSTASEQMARLEGRIGARLLHRSSRGLTLTEAGRAYLCQIDDVLDRVRRAEKAAQAEANEPRGRLRVSVPGPFAWTHIAPLLPEFMARHPEVTLELQVTAEVVDLVAAGFDLAIRLCPTSGPDVIVRRLGETRMIVVAAPALVAARGVPTRPEDLAAWPCLVNSTYPTPNEWTFSRGDEKHCFVFAPALVVNSMDVLQHLALSGSGAAFLSEYGVVEDLRAGRLVRILPEWDVVDVPVLAVYPDNQQISAKVRAFVDFVARRLEPGMLLETPGPKLSAQPVPSSRARRSRSSLRQRVTTL